MNFHYQCDDKQDRFVKHADIHYRKESIPIKTNLFCKCIRNYNSGYFYLWIKRKLDV